MALDAATLALTAKELESQLVDARIDKIFEPTRDEIVLNLRSRTAAYSCCSLRVPVRRALA